MFHRTTSSVDGVAIAYSVSGTADTAIVFIHDGLADRSFWDGQHAPFSHNYRVIALDLAGHGESGRDRQKWGIAEFALDVLAVLDAERTPAPSSSAMRHRGHRGRVARQAVRRCGDWCRYPP